MRTLIFILLVLSAAIVPGETNFAFRARLLDVHPLRQVAVDTAPVATDETAIDASWRIATASDDPVLAHAAHDLQDYLGKWGMLARGGR